MKNIEIKKRLKKLIALGSLSFVLVITGCSSKENNAEPTNEATTEVESNNHQETSTDINDTQETENNNEKETIEDNEIVKYFENKNEEMDNIIYTDNIEATKEFWNDYFIDAVDIIFYDKEYEGSSFSKLNPEAQQKCIDELKEAENKMNEINPNWQEDLGNIKDLTAETYNNLLPKIEELIGTGNYEKIKEIINKIKNGISNGWDSVTDMAEDLYQGYKSRNTK